MILISGTGYWSTGITVRWQEHAGTRNGVPHSGWTGRVEFCDEGFCDDDADAGKVSTEGVLKSRYAVGDGDNVSGLRALVDALLVDAARIGVSFTHTAKPCLYYDGDSENQEFPPPPGWKRMLADEAQRIGFESPCTVPVVAEDGDRG